ncbi:FIST signal transduction protein [Actinoplanes sp. CA-030573]|uniref:FIST signal transduction protein n=1 Tax=Actinoplanes sp. CA-030573 TaxID=3239898 RepID=UPI003D93B32E
MQINPHRWFGAGQSSAADSAKAGAEAAAEATGGRVPKAVFVFSSVAHDLPALLAAVREEAGPDAAIVGSTTMGELGNGGMTVGGVAVAALGGDGFTVHTRVAVVDEHDPRAAGVAAAEALRGLHDDNRVLILLCDGMTGHPHEIVRGAYSSAGAAYPLVGGFGADDRHFERTYQFHGDEVFSGAVVGVALGSDGPIGIGIAHGWRRIEPPMIVTKSHGAHIYELDDAPALDVLLDRNDFEGTAAEFFDRGRQLQPLGLSRRNGEDIRVIHAGDDEERSVWGTADVPQGALVWLMEADRQALLDGATWSCTEAVARLDGLAPLGVLAFDCGGRRAGLVEGGGGMEDEIAAMREALHGAPFAGFYTTGEIARVRGASGLHHLTLVTLALA